MIELPYFFKINIYLDTNCEGGILSLFSFALRQHHNASKEDIQLRTQAYWPGFYSEVDGEGCFGEIWTGLTFILSYFGESIALLTSIGLAFNH